MAEMVMPRDVIKPNCAGNAIPLIKLAGIGPEVRIIDDPRAVAFEMPVIDRIEPDQRREQSPVGLGDPVTHQIAVV